MSKLAGAIGQAQQAVNLAPQLCKRLGALAMPFRLVQVMGDFKHHRNLGGKSAGTANILLGDAGVVRLVSALDPLLMKVPRRILGNVIKAGLAHPEPSVRAFCSLIQGFAEFSQ